MLTKIGRITPANTGTNAMRGDQLGGLVISGGEYKDTTLGGKLFFAYCASQNVALFTATAAIGLQIYNPPSSGVNLVIHKWSCIVWATSATSTGLMLAVASAPVIAPATVTAATLAGRALLTGSTGLAIGACTPSSIATIAAPAAVWPLFHNTAAIASTGAEKMEGDLEGSFAFAPGTVAVFGALGAAFVTANLACIYEEVPVGL